MTPKLSARSKENYKLYETLKKLYGDTKVETPKIDPPPHYVIPGTSLELIDVIKASLTEGEFQAACWFSLEQYAYRWFKKGDAENDLSKLLVYGNWLLESVKKNGVCIGKQ